MDPFINSLLRWLQTFEINVENVNCLTDGIELSKVLNKIVPDYFDSNWLMKLKENLNEDQWRLKISNLKKLIQKIIDYFETNLYINLDSKFYPDANLIVKNKDNNELSKLIQLILGISVNCENKQLYIQEITKLDLDVQQDLMKAIEPLLQHNEQNEQLNNELTARSDTTSLLDLISVDNNNLKYLKEQLLKTLETIRQLTQKEDELNELNFELKNKLKLSEEEKTNLQKEIERLNLKLQTIEKLNSENQKDELNEHNHHVIKLKSKVDNLEKELLRSESQKEELQIKKELMQNDLNQLNQVNEELKKKVKEAKLLKDELDIHRHSADKLVKYEETIDTYKKKLEELSDIKKHVRILEDKNKMLVGNNIELEEEIKKINLLKNQINDYKKQVSELHQQVIEKTHKCDKNEFDLKKLNEKYDILLEEKQLLEKEKFELKSQLDSTDKANNLDSNFSLIDPETRDSYGLIKHNLNFEIKSEELDIKEKLLRLELENKHLKSKLDEANQEDLCLVKANYEDAKQRISELENDNRNLNKKLIEFESKLNDFSNSNDDSKLTSKSELVHLVEELKVEIKSLKQKLNDKEHLLSKKDEKVKEIEQKYRIYVDRAKQAFSALEPASLNHLTINSSLQSNLTHFNADTFLNPESIINQPIIEDPIICSNLTNEQLVKLLTISNQKFENLKQDYEKYKNLTEFEIRLMTSSIHNFGFNLMRNSATERLKNGTGLSLQSQNSFYGSTNSNLNSSNLSLNGLTNQSFLTKQRQACSKRINLEKVSNS